MLLFLVLPAWASGDYFAADRQAIVDGLTAVPTVRTRGLIPSRMRSAWMFFLPLVRTRSSCTLQTGLWERRL